MSGRIALFLGSSLFALVLVEGMARMLRPGWTLFLPPVCLHPDVFEQTAWGYRLHPNRTLLLRLSPRGAGLGWIRSNAEGFRALRDVAADDSRPRVAMLGDSMIFGVGVGEKERVTERLEEAAPEWRVDNLAMVGFGPDLMLRALEAVAIARRPAVVVMTIYSDDLRRLAPLYAGVGFPIPRYRLDDATRLVTVPYPEPRPWEQLRLVQGLLYARWRYTDAAYPLTAAILDRWRDLGRRHGFRPLLVFIPRERDGFEDRRRRRWLGAWAREANVPYVDLTDVMHAGGPPRYLAHDPHWSPVGHRLAAEAIRPLL